MDVPRIDEICLRYFHHINDRTFNTGIHFDDLTMKRRTFLLFLTGTVTGLTGCTQNGNIPGSSKSDTSQEISAREKSPSSINIKKTTSIDMDSIQKDAPEPDDLTIIVHRKGTKRFPEQHIEIKNTGGKPLNMKGLQVQFSTNQVYKVSNIEFPPGAELRVMIFSMNNSEGKTSMASLERYPPIYIRNAEFKQSPLKSNGTIKIKDTSGEVITKKHINTTNLD